MAGTKLKALLCAGALALSAPARADIVCDWMELGTTVSEASATPAAPPAVESARADTHLALAMFEALNAIDRRYESWVKLAPAPKGASQNAAAATAAYQVLLHYYPGQKATLDDAYMVSMSLVPDEGSRAAGKAVGEAAAKAVLATGAADEKAAPVYYRPRTSPGVWVATQQPVLPLWLLTLKRWVLPAADSVRPGPPPALNSARWAQDFNEVRTLGAKASKARNPLQTIQARFWVATDLDPTLRWIADLPGRSPVQNARLFSLVSMASDDAGVAIADAKYHYNFWRPITSIRNAEEDGNPATAADPAWEPLLQTPNHPEYPCGHCIGAATIAAVLETEIGQRPPGGVQFTTRRVPGVVQSLPTLDAYVKAMSMSRIYAGVHYRFSNEAAEDMGRKIGRMTVATALRPLK